MIVRESAWNWHLLMSFVNDGEWNWLPKGEIWRRVKLTKCEILTKEVRIVIIDF